MQTRRERLLAPPSWWCLGLAFALAWGWVALVVSTTAAAVVTAVVVALVVGAVLWVWGATAVEAGPDGLRVGRAHLDAAHVGRVRALDAAATREVLGPRADARAWLHVRPYVDTALLVEVDDDADPTPYWLVSSRDPALLAAALERPDRGHPGPAPDPTTTDPR